MQSCCFGFEQHRGVGSLSPREARSKGDQQPDGRVAHNQKLSNIFGVDTGILATRVLRARKARKRVMRRSTYGLRLRGRESWTDRPILSSGEGDGTKLVRLYARS